jgi:SNF2 family DNA or RNA helicase
MYLIFIFLQKNHLQNYMKESLAHIAIVSYETYTNQAILDQQLNQWDLLICDEAHLLKNPATGKSKALKALNCARRILLTGTPIQNNLKELYEILDLANPNCLGSEESKFCKQTHYYDF